MGPSERLGARKEEMTNEQNQHALVEGITNPFANEKFDRLNCTQEYQKLMGRRLYERSGGQFFIIEESLKIWLLRRLVQLRITSYEALVAHEKEHPHDLVPKPEDFCKANQAEGKATLLEEIKNNMPFAAYVGPFKCQLRYEYRGDELIDRNKLVNMTICFPTPLDTAPPEEKIIFYRQMLSLTTDDLPQGTPRVPMYRTLQLGAGVRDPNNQFTSLSELQQTIETTKLELEFVLKYPQREKIVSLNLAQPIPNFDALQRILDDTTESYGTDRNGLPVYPFVTARFFSPEKDLINTAREVIASGKMDIEWSLIFCRTEATALATLAQTHHEMMFIRIIVGLYQNDRTMHDYLNARFERLNTVLNSTSKTRDQRGINSEKETEIENCRRKLLQKNTTLTFTSHRENMLKHAIQELLALEEELLGASPTLI